MSGTQTQLSFVPEDYVAPSPKRAKRDYDPELMEGMDKYQTSALQDIQDGHNVFLTGAGGCGKTFLLKRLHDWLLKQEPRHKGAITSTTGITALLIEGRTVASFFGFGITEGTPEEMWKLVQKKRYIRDRIKKLTILVIDEVSMLSDQTFNAIDYVMRKFRKRANEPFGAVQMLLCGDFLQLEPVKGRFAFKSPMWNLLNLKYHLLKGTHRQADDSAYRTVLSDVRQGELSAYVRNTLQDLVGAKLDLPEGIHATELYSRRVDAEQANQVFLEALDASTSRTYKASVTWMSRGTLNSMACESVEKSTLKNMVTPANLELRLNAQVMLTINMDLEEGLANGSIGKVIGYEEVMGDKDDDVVAYPIVRFTNDVVKIIKPHSWPFKDLVDKYHIVIKQVPLILSWANTTHKIQGATLDFACIKLDNSMFANGMAYVALSRVRGMKYVTLKSYQSGSIRVSQDALAFYRENNLI